MYQNKCTYTICEYMQTFSNVTIVRREKKVIYPRPILDAAPPAYVVSNHVL